MIKNQFFQDGTNQNQEHIPVSVFVGTIATHVGCIQQER